MYLILWFEQGEGWVASKTATSSPGSSCFPIIMANEVGKTMNCCLVIRVLFLTDK